MTDRFSTARDLIRSGLDARAYPAAAIEVGRASGPLWGEAFGRLSYDETAPDCQPDTIFDLASLTKVIATTSLVMRAIGDRALSLATPVAALIPAFHGAARDAVTIRHLLDHSS